MGIVFTAAVLAAALAWLVLVRRGRLQPAVGGHAGHPGPAKIAALILLGLCVCFFLIFAVAELAGGDAAGAQHLLPAAVLAGLLGLAWTRPRAAGLVLLPLAGALGVAFTVEVVRSGESWMALSIPLVPLLTALLLLRAGRRNP